jgi:hypothetical protein
MIVPHVVSSFYFNDCSTCGQFILFHWLFHTWSVHFISMIVPHVVSSFYFIDCSTCGQFILFQWLFHTWSVHFISMIVPHVVSSFYFIDCSTRGQFILFQWLFHMWSVHFIYELTTCGTTNEIKWTDHVWNNQWKKMNWPRVEQPMKYNELKFVLKT